MTTDPANTAPGSHRPALFVESDAHTFLPGADAVIRPSDDAGSALSAGAAVIWRWSPGQSLPAAAARCAADCSLDAVAALARDRAGLVIVPRAEVRQSASRYAFVPARPGEGFSTYRLDPGSVADFLVVEGGRETRLVDWLKRAVELGFQTAWLHGVDAAGARRGFPIELLRKARRLAPGMTFWLSGGGWAPRHFARLAAEESVAAVVVPERDFAALGPDALRAAMAPIEAIGT